MNFGTIIERACMNVGVTPATLPNVKWQLVCDAINEAQRAMFDAMNLPAWREIYKDDGEISVVSGTTRYSLGSRVMQRLGAWNIDPNSWPSVRIEVISEADADRMGIRNTNFRAGSPAYCYIVPAPPHNTPLVSGTGANATEGSYEITFTDDEASPISASTVIGYEIFLNNEDAAYVITDADVSGQAWTITVDRPIRSRVSGSSTGHTGSGYTDVPCYIRRYGAQQIDILPMPMMNFTLRYRYVNVPLWMQNSTDRPSMPDNWHDAFVHKATSTILMLEEKTDLAQAWENKWLARLGECRARQQQADGLVSTIRTAGFNDPSYGPYVPFDGMIGPALRRRIWR